MTNALPTQDTDRDLVLVRTLNAPREKVFRCWTEGELMKQWFAPRPWTTTKVDNDLRPGGRATVTMADEQGNEYPNPGQYVEIVHNERLVFTDAFTGDWTPSEKPFFTAFIQLEDAGEGKTRYTAVARHWSAEDAASHKSMGFHDGWGKAASQLEEVASRI
jgi:uncharacterized protein YndB with AHSA1/START domain